jgi:hypothetical protein
VRERLDQRLAQCLQVELEADSDGAVANVVSRQEGSLIMDQPSLTVPPSALSQFLGTFSPFYLLTPRTPPCSPPLPPPYNLRSFFGVISYILIMVTERHSPRRLRYCT